MIFADYNSTTPLCGAAREWMNRACETWGNPNSSHKGGRQANELLELSRRTVAERLGVPPSEVVFTSGGSEANTAALVGSFLESKQRPYRILTSPVEHSSINGTLEFLATQGCDIQYVRILPSGELDREDFESRLHSFRPNLVSLMGANNETGVIFPASQIAEACHSIGARFHCDAVQAFGKAPARDWIQADLVSVSAHKIYGPKGVGALIIRNGVKLVSTHFGGAQEVKRRGGTQNVVGIAGFGGACTDFVTDDDSTRISALRERFESKLTGEGITVLANQSRRVPNTSNLRIPGIGAQVLLTALDLDGICVSAGSACASGSLTPSHVLTAMGLTLDEAKECVRFSWGRLSTPEEIDTAAETMLNHVKRIRARRG